MLFRFAGCILDTRAYSLNRDGESRRLSPKVFQVLHYLLTHRDRVVTKQELSEEIWPDLFVSDGTLETTLSAVRRAVGDSGRAQRIIRTLPGHGYQFIEDVEVEAEAEPVDGDAPEPVCAVDETEPDLGSPPAEAEAAVLRTLPGAGERKLVTVLCCALGWPAARPPQLALDTLYDLMQALYDVAQHIVQPYGGTLQPVTGDHLVAIFGAPVAHEDHAQRAALVALELNRHILEEPGVLWMPSGEPPALRTGLCTGLVAVRGMGDSSAELMSVIGEAASQAVLLCERARPEAVLCDERTARLIQSVTRVEALSWPEGASGEEVYHVQRIERAYAAARRFGDRSLTDFVDRERELEQLLTLLQEVASGRGHVVGVVGEPGIGKSRLSYELRRRMTHQPFSYLQGRCLSYGMATPYLPVLDLLRQLCDLTEADPPHILTPKVYLQVQRSGMPPEVWTPYLLWLLGVQTDAQEVLGLSPQALKDRIFEALLQLLAARCVQRPLIIEIEDLHWLDPTSEAFLTALVERLPGLCILLLCTYRPGYDPPWMNRSYATQIALRRLAQPNSQRIVQSVLAEMALSSALEQELLSKADGNPFFSRRIDAIGGGTGEPKHRVDRSGNDSRGPCGSYGPPAGSRKTSVANRLRAGQRRFV